MNINLHIWYMFISKSLRPGWSTEWLPGQTDREHTETLYWKAKPKTKKKGNKEEREKDDY